MSNWEPGQIAQRAGYKRYKWGKIVVPVFVATAWSFPALWALEHLRLPFKLDESSTIGDLYPALLAIGAALVASFGYWRWLRKGERWQADNGTLVYAGAQPTADLDFDRVQYAFDAASSQINPFDAPLRRRTDKIDLTEPQIPTFDRLWNNLRYTLRPSDPSTSTNLVVNYLWPFAVRLGYALAESLARSTTDNGLVLWHLAENPASRNEKTHLVGELIDVIDVVQLKETARSPDCPGLYAYPGPAQPGAVDKPAPSTGEPYVVWLVVGAEPGGADMPHAGIRLGEHPAEASGSDRGASKVMAEPAEFTRLAKACANQIVEALSASGDAPVHVYSRLPKTIAFATGMALYHQLRGATQEPGLLRLVFMNWTPEGSYDELKLWTERHPTPAEARA